MDIKYCGLASTCYLKNFTNGSHERDPGKESKNRRIYLYHSKKKEGLQEEKYNHPTIDRCFAAY